MQSGYPPGSTFKVVTATAALDSGRYTPDSVVDGKSPKEHRRRAADELRRRGLRPDHAHRRAHATPSTRSGHRSARSSARATMFEYMERYGFDRKPLLDLPARRDARERRLRRNGDLLRSQRRDRHRPRRDRAGAPRRSTPLQMALVAAAVANGGSLMRPHLVRDRIVTRTAASCERDRSRASRAR